MLLYPSMVPLLAHHQMFVIVVLQSQTLEWKTRVWLHKTVVTVLCRLTWMYLTPEISVQSSVSSLQSLSVHLDPRSLVGLTTLVAAFLNSSKRGSYAWYCSWSPGTPSSDCDIMIPDKEECCQHALDLLIQPLRWDKSHRHILANSTLKEQRQLHELAVTMNSHCSIPFSIPPFHSTVPFHRLETPLSEL